MAYLCLAMTIDASFLKPVLKERENDSHKGDYGHLLIVAGCQTMPGAAVLSTGAALQSGCGLVTLHSTERALQAAAVNFPSAMLSEIAGACFDHVPDRIGRYSAIAVGPGLGRAPETSEALGNLIDAAREAGVPLVLDADALNLMAASPSLLDRLPAGSVLTPHLGELRRLVPQPTEECIRALSRRTGCVIIVKGYRSKVYTPEGECHVNTTGNPGMAKGGSGDVLTGLVGGLLARGYSAEEAACLGVWIHGYAGDCLTRRRTAEAYSSRDLIDSLHEGFAALFM
jgi:NAD(P)H-hydrate epimerase